MKKTLIALAAVAVSTGAMAQAHIQASISGNVTVGFEAAETDAGVKTSGMGVNSTAINFRASEDLGGGLTASVSMGLENFVNAAQPTSTGTTLSLRGGFGSLAFANTKNVPNGLRALAGAGAPVRSDFATGFTNGTPGLDALTYSAPKMGDLTFSITLTDKQGIAVGQKGSDTQTSTMLAAVYGAGPINARIDYTSYGKKELGSKFDKRTRISGNYNLGVARIGAGYSTLSNVGSNKTTQSMIGISVPVGAVTVGATAQNHETKVGATTTKFSGTSIGVRYDLSKRTNIVVRTASAKEKSKKSKTRTEYLLSHSF